MRHTRYGWWLEEAGPVEPTPPLDGDTTADVVVVGGGYLGLWTAWQLRQLEPELDVVVLEAGLAGHGPSGRNGGFVSTLWDDLPILRERVGDERALEVVPRLRARRPGIGAWCDEQGVDAWFRAAPTLLVATSEAQLGDADELVEACAAVGAPEEVRAVEADELARALRSRASSAAAAAPHLGDGASGAALARPSREGARGAGFGSTSARRCAGSAGRASRRRRGTVRAGHAVLAVNSATASFDGFRLAHAVASSHIVLTEPVPDVLEDLGWTGGEPIADGRTLLHYLRTTPGRTDRIRLGRRPDGLRRPASGRLEVDPRRRERRARDLLRFFPQLAGRRITHAWGGPIDVSPTHLPIFGSHGRVHHGFGFTGNGVGPSFLGGEILARLALDRRDELTRLALVDPERKLMPPEPLRWAGGTAIRGALVRADAAEDEGRRPGGLTRLVAGLPRRLGLHLPR